MINDQRESGVGACHPRDFGEGAGRQDADRHPVVFGGGQQLLVGPGPQALKGIRREGGVDSKSQNAWFFVCAGHLLGDVGRGLVEREHDGETVRVPNSRSPAPFGRSDTWEADENGRVDARCVHLREDDLGQQ
ncbi:hypothetical protein BC342_31480 [Streptomyces olivaceus]|nr:hypothetical protein BC342_31480 [Streptomyces olivaceus]